MDVERRERAAHPSTFDAQLAGFESAFMAISTTRLPKGFAIPSMPQSRLCPVS